MRKIVEGTRIDGFLCASPLCQTLGSWGESDLPTILFCVLSVVSAITDSQYRFSDFQFSALFFNNPNVSWDHLAS